MDGEVLPVAPDLYLLFYAPPGHFDQDDYSINNLPLASRSSATRDESCR